MTLKAEKKKSEKRRRTIPIDPYKDVPVEATQIVVKTLKKMMSKEASNRAKAKVMTMKKNPTDVDLSSTSESSSIIKF
jgi:hypothetical protein